MKKILFVIPHLGVGGTNSSLDNLLNEIKSWPGLSISVFSISTEGFYKFQNNYLEKSYSLLNYWFGAYSSLKGQKQIKSFAVKVVKKLSSLIGLDVESFLLRRYSNKLSKNKYDVIIGFQEGIATKFSSMLETNKLINWVQCDLKQSNYLFDDYKESYICSDNIICVSKNAANTFRSIYNTCDEKIKVIYNLIDTQSIISMSNYRDVVLNEFGENTFVILSVGRFSKVKQFEKIPEIASYLKCHINNFKWIVVGAGNIAIHNELESYIKKYNVGDVVELVGQRENPYPFFKRADLYVCLSLSESCPMVFLEANALKTFIISNNFPSASELIVNDNMGKICNFTEIPYEIVKFYNSDRNEVRINDNFRLDTIKQLKDLFYD